MLPQSEPRCIGMWEACATQRPAASNMPTEQSLRSLMLVENEARISVLPMSSVIDSRRLLNTSMAMGSNSRFTSDIPLMPLAPARVRCR